MSHAVAERRVRVLQAAQACRACGEAQVGPLLAERSVPLYCNVLWPDRAGAVNAPRGPLRLSVCHRCGHVYNEAFAPERLDYTPAYENSLHYSGHFSAYAEGLARSLVERHGVHDGFVVDVGCGRGDFLGAGLPGRWKSRPRLRPELPARGGCARPGGPNIGFVAEFFSRTTATPPIDLLCCRQVLEHIADPERFSLR